MNPKPFIFDPAGSIEAIVRKTKQPHTATLFQRQVCVLFGNNAAVDTRIKTVSTELAKTRAHTPEYDEHIDAYLFGGRVALLAFKSSYTDLDQSRQLSFCEVDNTISYFSSQEHPNEILHDIARKPMPQSLLPIMKSIEQGYSDMDVAYSAQFGMCVVAHLLRDSYAMTIDEHFDLFRNLERQFNPQNNRE